MKRKTGGQTVENQRFPTVQTPRFSDGAGCEGSSHSGLADEDIIKALERLKNTKDYLKEQYREQVKKCPYAELKPIAKQTYEDNKKAFDIAIKAIEEFTRQKAEIERLRKENEILSTNADNAFQEGLNESRELFKQEVEAAIRAEAIKDVLLTLQAEAESSDKYIREYDDSEVQKAYNQALWKTYNLVKEMVGEE